MSEEKLPFLLKASCDPRGTRETVDWWQSHSAREAALAAAREWFVGPFGAKNRPTGPIAWFDIFAAGRPTERCDPATLFAQL